MAPALPSGPTLPNLGAVISQGLGDWADIGQILLGAAFMAVALLLLLSETKAGGQIAHDTRRAVVTAGKLALTKGL